MLPLFFYLGSQFRVRLTVRLSNSLRPLCVLCVSAVNAFITLRHKNLGQHLHSKIFTFIHAFNLQQ